jgi:hypothetical protein
MPEVNPTIKTTFPAQDAAVVTPSDSALSGSFRALYVGVSGHVTLVTAAGNSVLFSNVPVGILPVAGRGVRVTGTSASLIIALT